MKLSWRFAAFVLAAVIVMGTVIMPSFATEPEGNVITTAEELAAISDNGTYYLGNDILISGKWDAIPAFSGTLDGNGHSIVFSSAVVTGGIFEALSGATVKNLQITEEGSENIFMPVQSGSYCYFGTVACFASGTVENVISDVDIDIRGYYTSACGGIVGAVKDGDLTLSGCINNGDVGASYYTGGIVGAAIGATTAALTVEGCANYGLVTGSDSVGGMVGCIAGTCLDIYIRECANYGEVIHYSSNNGGGMIGWLKPASSEGTVDVSNNINYGMVSNEGLSSGKTTGIIGSMNTNSSLNTTVSGNINYYPLAPISTQTAGTVAAINYVSVEVSENNYTVAITALGNSDINALPIDENTAATLVGLYPDTFVAGSDGKISLKWMSEKSIGSECPAFTYTIRRTGGTKAPSGTPVSNAGELAAISGNGTYYISDDITITGAWTSPSGFSGTLDGNGHSIILDGATVSGGLFNSLNGAIIKNLTVEQGENKNTFTAKSTYFGILSDSAYGIFENITVSADIDLSSDTTAYAGGLFGSQSASGAMYLTNCVNNGNVSSGKCAAGMIGSVIASNYYTSLIRCVNNGYIVASTNCGGGLIAFGGGAGGIRIQYCINNGDILINNTQNAGGILGYVKLKDNFAYIGILNNINRGNVSDNVTTGGTLAGIAAYINFRGSAMEIVGNINYGVPSGGKNSSPILTTGTSTRVLSTSDNFTVEVTNKGTTTAAQTHSVLDENSLATLNAKYAGVYAPLADGKITLAWTVMSTVTGASVRLNSPAGLRFSSDFAKDYIDSIVAEYGAENVVVGTLITPDSYVREAGAFTKEALDLLDAHSVKYLDVTAGEALKENTDSYTYAGSVANIKEVNYSLNYAGIGYIS
ncbi:MAG: hypothetical protein ACI3XQ_09890, partial [Eubacteriales bacterium]